MIRIVRDLLSAFFLLGGTLLIGSAVAAYRADAPSWWVYLPFGVACLVAAWMVTKSLSSSKDRTASSKGD